MMLLVIVIQLVRFRLCFILARCDHLHKPLALVLVLVLSVGLRELNNHFLVVGVILNAIGLLLRVEQFPDDVLVDSVGAATRRPLTLLIALI